MVATDQEITRSPNRILAPALGAGAVAIALFMLYSIFVRSNTLVKWHRFEVWSFCLNHGGGTVFLGVGRDVRPQAEYFNFEIDIPELLHLSQRIETGGLRLDGSSGPRVYTRARCQLAGFFLFLAAYPIVASAEWRRILFGTGFAVCLILFPFLISRILCEVAERGVRRATVPFDLAVPFFAIGLPSAFIYRLDRRRLTRPGNCQSCGYNLTGNVSGICPECGTKLSVDGPRIV